jgi:hypothetical protein
MIKPGCVTATRELHRILFLACPVISHLKFKESLVQGVQHIHIIFIQLVGTISRKTTF